LPPKDWPSNSIFNCFFGEGPQQVIHFPPWQTDYLREAKKQNEQGGLVDEVSWAQCIICYWASRITLGLFGYCLASPWEAYLGLMKYEHQALYLFAEHGGDDLL
jgi:hypothetical protein